MRAWLREHRFAFSDVFVRLGRQPLSAALNILVVGIALALPLFGLTVLADLEPVLGTLAREPELSVFLKPGTTRSDAQALEASLRALPGVGTLRFVSREAALDDLKRRPGMDAVIAALPENPLPDAWIVRLADTGTDQGGLSAREDRLAERLRTMPHVDRVLVDSEWLERIDALFRFLRLGVLLLGLALGTAVVAVIFNTVRLQVLTQSEEIELARLIGATARFVRRPFYYLGAVEGLAGGVLAWIFVAAALIPLNAALGAFTRLYGSAFRLAEPPTDVTAYFLGSAALLGWFAATLSVGRHLSRAAR